MAYDYGPNGQVAFYFLFYAHYTTWLLWLSLISVIIGIDVLIEGNVDATLSPYYSIVVVLWAILMLEFWKRTEATKALHWGMLGE